MNVTIERLFEKIGRLHLSQDLLIEENNVVKAENAALKEALKIADAVKAEIEKIGKDGENVGSAVLTRIKAAEAAVVAEIAKAKQAVRQL